MLAKHCGYFLAFSPPFDWISNAWKVQPLPPHLSKTSNCEREARGQHLAFPPPSLPLYSSLQHIYFCYLYIKLGQSPDNDWIEETDLYSTCNCCPHRYAHRLSFFSSVDKRSLWFKCAEALLFTFTTSFTLSTRPH